MGGQGQWENPARSWRLREAPVTGSKQESVPRLGLLRRKVRASFLNLLGQKGSRLPGRPRLMLWAVGMGVGQGVRAQLCQSVLKGT